MGRTEWYLKLGRLRELSQSVCGGGGWRREAKRDQMAVLRPQGTYWQGLWGRLKERLKGCSGDFLLVVGPGQRARSFRVVVGFGVWLGLMLRLGLVGVIMHGTLDSLGQAGLNHYERCVLL